MLILIVIVVYRSIPTSNRNRTLPMHFPVQLYIVLFLHQTATNDKLYIPPISLYIVLFLHQTATMALVLESA